MGKGIKKKKKIKQRCENSYILTDTQIGKIIYLKRNGEFAAAAVIVTLMANY